MIDTYIYSQLSNCAGIFSVSVYEISFTCSVKPVKLDDETEYILVFWKSLLYKFSMKFDNFIYMIENVVWIKILTKDAVHLFFENNKKNEFVYPYHTSNTQ